jgi:uncharacterized protein (DUF885 family)
MAQQTSQRGLLTGAATLAATVALTSSGLAPVAVATAAAAPSTAAPSAAVPTVAAPNPTSLRAVMADYDQWERDIDPVTAGDEGDEAALFRLPDPSPAAADARRTALFEFQRRLIALKSVRMGDSDRLNRDLLLRAVEDALDDASFDPERMPFTAYWSFSTFGESLARRTVIRSRLEADAYLSRITALPAWYDQQIANARRGLVTGFVQPRLVAEVALRTARKQAAATVEDSPLMGPLAKLPASIAPEAQAELRQRATAIVRNQVLPAQKRIATFLETEYLPRARAGLAARDLPDGERYYAAQVHRHTTTRLSPDEIHQIGLDEVRRIRGEMDKVIAETGFKGSFREFVAFLRTDPQFYPRTRDELLQRYQVVAKRIDPELPRLFGRLPRLTYGVKPIPEATEEGQTTAYYEGGSPARGVAGTYAVNLSHLDQRPLYEIPTLTLHEAVPGHHLQIAMAQEQSDTPNFRRHMEFTAFVEGWGLYAEQLGGEIGIYQNAYERFGQLSYEMWRACRLVADTGIHWKRWTRDQARACFIENTALAEHNIDTEVDRYISWPGQALAYKIGELRIIGLRRKAEATLGTRFDERRFHDAVLTAGALPLDVLESRVTAWINREVAAAQPAHPPARPGPGVP